MYMGINTHTCIRTCATHTHPRMHRYQSRTTVYTYVCIEPEPTFCAENSGGAAAATGPPGQTAAERTATEEAEAEHRCRDGLQRA